MPDTLSCISGVLVGFVLLLIREGLSVISSRKCHWRNAFLDTHTKEASASHLQRTWVLCFCLGFGRKQKPPRTRCLSTGDVSLYVPPNDRANPPRSVWRGKGTQSVISATKQGLTQHRFSHPWPTPIPCWVFSGVHFDTDSILVSWRQREPYRGHIFICESLTPWMQSLQRSGPPKVSHINTAWGTILLQACLDFYRLPAVTRTK